MLKATTSIINASQIATPITLPGDVTLSTGNLIIGTSGKGIDFSATSGTGTSELLADYEEGTWTPNQGAGVTVVGAFSSVGRYTKVGRLVTIEAQLDGSTTIACVAGIQLCTNIPFTANGAVNSTGSSSKGVGADGGVLVGAASTTVFSTTTFGASAASIIFTASYSV
jgi:hypothetical protein